MIRNTARALLWPLALVVLTGLILAAGLLALLGMFALGASRRRRADEPESRRAGLASVVHLDGPAAEVVPLPGPPAEVVPGPPAQVVPAPSAEATLGRAA